MLNLYGVTIWHSSGLGHFEMIEVRTYSIQRAEHLARESFPCCRAIAELVADEFVPRVQCRIVANTTLALHRDSAISSPLQQR